RSRREIRPRTADSEALAAAGPAVWADSRDFPALFPTSREFIGRLGGWTNQAGLPLSLPIFVAAIADQPHQVAGFDQHRLDRGDVIGIERDIEDACIVGEVLRYAEPGAGDDPRDRRPVQHIAGADIGDAD